MFADPFLKLFILLLLYVGLLFLFRYLNVGKKRIMNSCNNACPDCYNPLNRIKRREVDKYLYYLTFRVFPFKRYLCDECGWEGLRWEDRFRP